MIDLRLDKAAYFALYGARLVKVQGEYGRTRYFMEVDQSVYDAIKKQPLVDYQKYMAKRQDYKNKARKASGQVFLKRSDWGKHHIQQQWSKGYEL